MNDLKFSIIVPVYNRKQEISELLESLSLQSDTDFEVMIMEGRCTDSCHDICHQYSSQLNIRFFVRDTGRSARRNEGMQLATGNYFLLFDSDCTLPPDYIAGLRKSLTDNYVDCYGGDSANTSFSDLQLAINYSMTSFMTTGGIRGGMKDVSKYLPRAFNMGFSRRVFEATGGYRDMIGEDVDLSMRIKEAGFVVRLIPAAVVYHKRRITLKGFYRQVNTFGKARILLTKLHPGSLKIIHLFPSCFALGNIFLILMSIIGCSLWWISPLLLYVALIFVESMAKNKSAKVALLSIAASYAQLCGYGFGLVDEAITRRASRKAAESLYRQ